MRSLYANIKQEDLSKAFLGIITFCVALACIMCLCMTRIENKWSKCFGKGRIKPRPSLMLCFLGPGNLYSKRDVDPFSLSQTDRLRHHRESVCHALIRPTLLPAVANKCDCLTRDPRHNGSRYQNRVYIVPGRLRSLTWNFLVIGLGGCPKQVTEVHWWRNKVSGDYFFSKRYLRTEKA